MIRFFLLQNKAGKTRLSKYYSPFTDEEKRRMEIEIHRLLTNRDAKQASFVEVRLKKPNKEREREREKIVLIHRTENWALIGNRMP